MIPYPSKNKMSHKKIAKQLVLGNFYNFLFTIGIR
jgi:hypothetical protein